MGIFLILVIFPRWFKGIVVIENYLLYKVLRMGKDWNEWVG